MKIRRALHCPEMELLLKKLPGWLFWASAAIVVYLILLFIAGRYFLYRG